MFHDPGVRNDHAARDPAEQAAAEVDDDREAVEKLQDHLAAEHDEGHRDDETEDDEKGLMRLMRLLRSARDGDDVVEAHDEVGHDDRLDRAHETAASFDLVVRAVVGNQKLHADPEKEHAARHLEEGEVQQHDREGDQNHAQGDRTRRAPENAEFALFVRQVSTGHGDDDGVVAPQENVDHDDLTDGAPVQIDQDVPNRFQNILRG